MPFVRLHRIAVGFACAMLTWVGRLRYGELNAASNAISYTMHRGRSHMPFSCAISLLQGPSFWLNNSKSLTLRRRSSRPVYHRGGVFPHPPRQGLLPSDAPPRATKRDSVAACDRSIFLRSFREHEVSSPTSHMRDRPAPRSGTDSAPRRLVAVLSSRILHKDREAHVVQSSPPMLRRKVVLEPRNSTLPR